MQNNLHEPFYDKNLTPTPYKYSVYVTKNKKPTLIHFGNRNYQQYHDKLGKYAKLDHGDNTRRQSYLARAKGIKNKQGKPTYKDKNSANYYSINYLW
jgi:hypothetical protein